MEWADGIDSAHFLNLRRRRLFDILVIDTDSNVADS